MRYRLINSLLDWEENDSKCRPYFCIR